MLHRTKPYWKAFNNCDNCQTIRLHRQRKCQNCRITWECTPVTIVKELCSTDCNHFKKTHTEPHHKKYLVYTLWKYFHLTLTGESCLVFCLAEVTFPHGAVLAGPPGEATAHCFKVSYRTFLSGKLPVFIVTAPNFQNMSAIPLSLLGYLGIHLKSCYMP